MWCGKANLWKDSFPKPLSDFGLPEKEQDNNNGSSQTIEMLLWSSWRGPLPTSTQFIFQHLHFFMNWSDACIHEYTLLSTYSSSHTCSTAYQGHLHANTKILTHIGKSHNRQMSYLKLYNTWHVFRPLNLAVFSNFLILLSNTFLSSNIAI